jgi:serine/threonine protein kinase/Tfp pilus assembly protein PilF
MTPERYQQIDQIFQVAIDLDPEQRLAFLNQVCSGDATIRSEVESLLTSDHGSPSFIEDGALDVAARLLARDEPELTSGEHIDRYKILSLLGSGGMGEVYLAHDEKLDRKIALKLLLNYLTTNQGSLRRFQQEARAASALNHPNIITIHEIGEVDDRNFIATEFVDGQTLRQRLKESSLNLAESLDIAIQVCSALSAAHQAGIVHRDIKPENIMLRRDRYVKVLDFGLAKLTEEREQGIDVGADEDLSLSSGLVMGTVTYMSPEQARGEQVDSRSDLFSLGVVLYEMITGHAPFVGDNAREVIKSILADESPPVDDVPSKLCDILNKTLRKDRTERYQTAEALLGDLKKAKQEIEQKSQPQHSAILNIALVAAAIVVVVGLLVGIQFARNSHNSANVTAPRKSIAVLPFKSLSGDPTDEYLTQGLAEAVITKLTGVREIIVRPLASVSKYNTSTQDAITIGRQLGVDVVLDGQIQRNGDRYRVTVQLWQMHDGVSLSSYTCDETCAQIFELEDSISERAMNALAIRLTTQEQRYLAKRYTNNKTVYDLYLKGRYQFYANTQESFAKSARYFQQAIDLAPDYAPAYAGLSDALYQMAWFDSPKSAELMFQSKIAANKALEIDDSLAEAHAAACGVKLQDWDWSGARTECERALELKPNYVRALSLYSGVLGLIGQYDKAIEASKRELEVDPLSITGNFDLGSVYLYAHHTDEAIEQLQKVIEMDRKLPVTHHFLANAYYQKGMYDNFAEKVIEIRSDPVLNHGDWNALGLTAEQVRDAYARGGFEGLLRAELDAVLAASKKEYVSPKRIAALYAMLGENDKAMDWLEKNYQEHSKTMMTIKVDPRLERLQSDPRFKEMLARVGLPQ